MSVDVQKDNTSLRKLQLIEIEVLKRFIEICDKNNIRYYIIGGALIGAVRHKGFIPWDDDIDIAVPRDDYYKLIEVMRGMQDDIIGMNYYRDNPELYYYPVRIIHKGYHIVEPRTLSGYANPWIDILPIDGAPDNKIAYALFKGRMLYYRMLLGMHYVDNLRDKERKSYERVIIKLSKVTRIGKYINPTKMKDSIDRLLVSHTIQKCHTIGTCMGAYFFHEFVPKEYFGQGSKLSFEGIEVCVPEKIDAYLTHMYGDYMKLPPESQRHAHDIEIL